MFNTTLLSLYLLVGLGIAIGVVSSSRISYEKSFFGCIGAFLAAIVGIILGLIVAVLWPTTLTVVLYRKIYNS